ncbi:MAG: helix-turn-helix transcriptional regulator [Calditrichaeota bacterium]|nr:helix-turn-helix transcriptional regulator [Calditrichota bacterium]MCB9474875.1 helix-turn-helix transcriptional regulator [Candidatus Delongbacteria bacterium]
MSNNRTLTTEELASCFRALGNPHRLRIFREHLDCCPPGTHCEVHDNAPACVGDIMEELDLAPSTVSHHLKELRQTGLIRMERRGRHMDCWVDPEVLASLADFFSQTLRSGLERATGGGACCAPGADCCDPATHIDVTTQAKG